ncbi:protein S100-A1-like isoform X2 [Plectropomus leopardus]|uniref:protein S100-A1-like isoform X2 n=1 Tax=Plectropomus leopardus TaxID=160734 RepID=UPI001C4AC012|nr:protein S100-A1-like isoform X2 [Plectropomus leopardus]
MHLNHHLHLPVRLQQHILTSPNMHGCPLPVHQMPFDLSICRHSLLLHRAHCQRLLQKARKKKECHTQNNLHCVPNMTGAIPEAMKLLRDTFNYYAKLDGEKQTLATMEMHVLLVKEFPNADRSIKYVDDILHKLDEDKDGVIDFKEFVRIVTDMNLMCS